MAVVFLFAGNAKAEVITARLSFDPPVVRSSDEGASIYIRGCRSIANPGEPLLPVYVARFIIPPGEEITKISVEPESEIEILTGALAPMPDQAPIGSTLPSISRSTLFSSSIPFPSLRGKVEALGISCGIRVAFVNIFPCVAIPAEGKVLFAPSVKVLLETAPSARAQTGPRSVRPERAMKLLKESVENSETQRLYENYSTDYDVGSTDKFEYVIITSPDFSQAFEALAAIKERCGMRSRIVDTAWIAGNFPGNDLQEKIRAFITFAYDEWSAEYILLGGDEEIIPHRGLYAKVGTTIDVNIASDLYYACLDGTWNTDGDSYYGEPGEEDLLPEVTLGRLPVDSEEEIANCIEKIERYTSSPIVDQCETALMVGELLWSENGVNTWGGDYKDEILFGSSNWGFSTAGIPPGFESSTLYDRDLGTWSATQLLQLLSAGVHLVNHAGHANLYKVMRLEPQHVAALSNDGITASYFICWSHGCYAASFDNRDPSGTVQSEDCIAEELLTGQAGAISFIGHSRLGWDAPGSTCGVSQFFDRRFFDAIFGRGERTIGKALDLARLDNIGYISYPAVRWVYYTLCLLGDPALGVWTSRPKELSVSRPSAKYQDQTSFPVYVQDDRGPVVGARVTLLSEEPPYFRSASSDSSGKAILEECTFVQGPIFLSVTSPDHLPFCDTIQVEATADFLAEAALVGLRDDLYPSCCGDGDGTAEPGEIVSPVARISNLGLNRLTEISVTLHCENSGIAVINGTAVISSLESGDSVSLDGTFILQVLQNFEGPKNVPLTFSIDAAEGSWVASSQIEVSAPRIELESWSASDEEGNANGCLESWEFQTLRCFYRNSGNSEIRSAQLSLKSLDLQFARVIKGTLSLGNIEPGGVIDSQNNLLFFVNESAPPFSRIRLVLEFSGENISTKKDTILVRICGYELEDRAENETLLEHRAIIGLDEWHITSESFHSAPTSWRCGGYYGGTYANLVESILTLPPICLFSGSSLSFWHRMSAEAQSSYPYWALDAGVLEVSTDGGNSWKIVSPQNQYPSRASPYNTIFLPPYQRCWSGSFDWREETFDLSSFSGPVLIRFHFASDEQRGFEGWYIDDLRITTTVPTDAPRESDFCVTGLFAPYPNPFNPTVTIPFSLASESTVRIYIFDVRGRRVRTLLDGFLEKGNHITVWDGSDQKGMPVASGIYFCRFIAGSYEASTRVILLR